MRREEEERKGRGDKEGRWKRGWRRGEGGERRRWKVRGERERCERGRGRRRCRPVGREAHHIIVVPVYSLHQATPPALNYCE